MCSLQINNNEKELVNKNDETISKKEKGIGELEITNFGSLCEIISLNEDKVLIHESAAKEGVSLSTRDVQTDITWINKRLNVIKETNCELPPI